MHPRLATPNGQITLVEAPELGSTENQPMSSGAGPRSTIAGSVLVHSSAPKVAASNLSSRPLPPEASRPQGDTVLYYMPGDYARVCPAIHRLSAEGLPITQANINRELGYPAGFHSTPQSPQPSGSQSSSPQPSSPSPSAHPEPANKPAGVSPAVQQPVPPPVAVRHALILPPKVVAVQPNPTSSVNHRP